MSDALVILIEDEEGPDPIRVLCSVSRVVHHTKDSTRTVELKMSQNQAAILRRQLKAGL